MAYGNSKDLPRKTAFHIVLGGKDLIFPRIQNKMKIKDVLVQ